MFAFFDYMFYKACEFYYNKEGSGSTSRTGGLLIVAMVQGFNLFSIFDIVCIIIHEKVYVNKFYFGIPIVVLIIANGIRYNGDKFDFDALRLRWENDSKALKKIKKNFVISYIILSAALFLGSAIYLGNKKW